MSLFLRVGNEQFSIGTSGFLNCFFSTIVVRLENERRGSVFPWLSTLYAAGKLDVAGAAKARDELAIVRKQLASFAPQDVVWDSDDRARRPPWGDNIASTITSLENYFWTNDGNDLLRVFDDAFALSQSSNHPLEIAH